jgi:hypothetical protein
MWKFSTKASRFRGFLRRKEVENFGVENVENVENSRDSKEKSRRSACFTHPPGSASFVENFFFSAVSSPQTGTKE